MAIEAASALPPEIGSHSSINTATNFLDRLDMGAVWQSDK
jgi:hypothetical protein